MPVATTSTVAGRTVLTPAAERVINNATATRAAKLAAAKRAADTLTPLHPPMPTEQLPEPPALFPETEPATVAPELAAQQTTLVISVTILHRGRLITIASEGRSLDAFCDLLDRRFGVPS